MTLRTGTVRTGTARTEIARIGAFASARSLARRTFAAALATLLFAAPQAAEAARTLVALGDSLTAGYGLGPGQSFAEQLEAALRKKGHDVTVVNAGVSGDTSAAGLARLDWSVPAEADAVIVELGANDMLRGIDPARTKANLTAILDRLAARRLPVLLSGMRAAPNLGQEYAARYAAIWPSLAARKGVIYDPFFLDGVAGQRRLNLPDGMHPTAEGVARIVSRILPKVEALLARVPAE